MPASRRPVPVVLLTGVLAAAGVALGWASLRMFGAPGPVQRPVLAGMLVLLAAAGYLILRVQYRDQIMALDLFEAVLAPAIFAFPAPAVVGLTASAVLIADVLRRNRPMKAAFNVAQWMSAAGAGSLVFGALREGTALSARNVGALVTAMSTVVVVNMLAFAIVMRLAEGERVVRVLERLAPSLLLGWGINTTFGLLFVPAFVWSRAAVALFLVPLVVLNWGYRGRATTKAERARLAGMQRATVALVARDAGDGETAIGRFLNEIRDCFECEAVDLVLQTNGSRTVHRALADGSISQISWSSDGHDESLAAALIELGRPVRVTAHGPHPVVVERLRREGWRDCLGAPMVAKDGIVGLICTYNRTGAEGFEDGELAVLEALAGLYAARGPETGRRPSI